MSKFPPKVSSHIMRPAAGNMPRNVEMQQQTQGRAIWMQTKQD